MMARSERQHARGCVISQSRCAPFVMFQQSAQRLVADDVIDLKLLDWFGCRCSRPAGIDNRLEGDFFPAE